ncbi:hypothetical protein WH96_06565 [Kiloniella spongiae]|uniref:Uncharacterized protein n=1 Tax=Kiloniella spongiae TaxID=1489064 RepID=A0A0H2MFG9_9PROT|nr:hypothetical protein [Kiloniella spongiae]KLN61309.1 hypothetical protein WH96_06565 [Kiloniella spongiae]
MGLFSSSKSKSSTVINTTDSRVAATDEAIANGANSTNAFGGLAVSGSGHNVNITDGGAFELIDKAYEASLDAFGKEAARTEAVFDKALGAVERSFNAEASLADKVVKYVLPLGVAWLIFKRS